MKTKAAILSFVLSGVASLPLVPDAQTATGLNLLSESNPIESAGSFESSDTPDSGAYANGVRAINEGRWPDAVAIFNKILDEAGDHADGALYWKAYAENKQGKGSQALDTCGKLRREHQGSKWIDECGALEIEIRAKTGQPVQPQAQQSDDLKLLALASLMQHDQKRALAQIQEILDSDASEKLKQGALYIMGEHPSDTIYPQIARISYVEGDVRISRGSAKERGKRSSWEIAVANLSLETGFSLVTGEGRAEIEFEDASTLYLGPNSVLTFNNLTTTRGIPQTAVALLTGTVTLHIRPYVSGEWFLLQTPTDNLFTKYPESADFRVSSYVDGIGMVSLGRGVLGLSGSDRQPLTPGQTLYFKNGRRILDAGPIHPPDFVAWDSWVASRYSDRLTVISQVMKASGLDTPLPGLAEMQGKGSFFDCEPYGTCWEPAAADSVQTKEPASSESASASAQTPQPGRNIRFLGSPTAATPLAQFQELQSIFPCVPEEVAFSLAGTVFQGSAQTLYPVSRFYGEPWTWAVCHSGSWLYTGHRYVWVVGRRHHHPPVHWVKYGHSVAFVPIHPRDVKDRLPVNRKSAVFAVSKEGHTIERIETPETRSIDLLKETPGWLRAAAMPSLARADEPHIEAHQIKDAAVAKGELARIPGIPITFNQKSQSFMMQREEMRGGKSVTVTSPINNHSGNLQARGGGLSGGNSHSGGGSAGGGSHGGGGSGGSSSGSQHSGGTSSSSSVSSSSSSSSSGSTTGGSSHH
jgi:hypothetical protein